MKHLKCRQNLFSTNLQFLKRAENITPFVIMFQILTVYSSHSRIYVRESCRKTNNHAHILDYKRENAYGKQVFNNKKNMSFMLVSAYIGTRLT